MWVSLKPRRDRRVFPAPLKPDVRPEATSEDRDRLAADAPAAAGRGKPAAPGSDVGVSGDPPAEPAC